MAGVLALQPVMNRSLVLCGVVFWGLALARFVSGILIDDYSTGEHIALYSY